MKIIRATHLGMCFGVRDAIDLAKKTALNSPVTVLGQLAHNPDVLRDLEDHGVRTANHGDPISTRTVMISAHGASEKRRRAIESAGHQVLEATCPLVHQAHRELRMLLLAGYYPVVIGKRGHVEVRGLTEDLVDFRVVGTPEEISTIPQHPKIGIVAQTTQPIERVNQLVQTIRERFPESDVQFMDTVCRPTKDRQSAAVDLAQRASVVIVIGGANSNNTHELVNTCCRFCHRVHHVQRAGDLRPEWFQVDDVVGITAGTSTPDTTIDEVEAGLRAIEFPTTPALACA